MWSGFLGLKLAFRRILHGSKLLLKVHFNKPCTIACIWKWILSCEQNFVPENGLLVYFYSVKVIKVSRLATDCLPVLWSLYKWLRCCEATPMRPKLLAVFLTASICSLDDVRNFLSASDRSHVNTHWLWCWLLQPSMTQRLVLVVGTSQIYDSMIRMAVRWYESIRLLV